MLLKKRKTRKRISDDNFRKLYEQFVKEHGKSPTTIEFCNYTGACQQTVRKKAAELGIEVIIRKPTDKYETHAGAMILIENYRKEHGTYPDIKTASELLNVIPNTVYEIAKKLGVKLEKRFRYSMTPEEFERAYNELKSSTGKTPSIELLAKKLDIAKTTAAEYVVRMNTNKSMQKMKEEEFVFKPGRCIGKFYGKTERERAGNFF